MLNLLIASLLQAQIATILVGFNSCLTGISRLYCRPELVAGVLGAKMSDLQEATPLAELVIAGDTEELVSVHGYMPHNRYRTVSYLFYAACKRVLEPKWFESYLPCTIHSCACANHLSHQ